MLVYLERTINCIEKYFFITITTTMYEESTPFAVVLLAVEVDATPIVLS